MNVYFIDPSYLQPEAWEPMLNYLKVKYVYSFIPKEQLHPILWSHIKHSIKGMYSGQKQESFSNICVYWLRSYFESNIRLATSDYPDLKDVPNEVLVKYGSQSPYNNIRNLDTVNCLILLPLTSEYSDSGCILPPKCRMSEFQDRNLPTHVASYCLNILRKKYQHNQYNAQTAFVLFDKHFKYTYRFSHATYRWNEYTINLKNNKNRELMVMVKNAVYKALPDAFPLIEKNGKQFYSPIITEEGATDYRQLINEVRRVAEDHRSWEEAAAAAEEWQQELADMTRGFWLECGEAASNCDSWPGWG